MIIPTDIWSFFKKGLNTKLFKIKFRFLYMCSYVFVIAGNVPICKWTRLKNKLMEPWQPIFMKNMTILTFLSSTIPFSTVTPRLHVAVDSIIENL